MKLRNIFALSLLCLSGLTACAKQPPEDVVKAFAKADVENRTMMATMYGGSGTGLQSITITKVSRDDRYRTDEIYICEYEAVFRYKAQVKGEKDRTERIKGRLSIGDNNGRWERLE